MVTVRLFVKLICIVLQTISILSNEAEATEAPKTVKIVKEKDEVLVSDRGFLLRSILISKNHVLSHRAGAIPLRTELSLFEDNDFSLGTHRADATEEQCNSQKNGGPAAKLGDNCSYDKWLFVRKPIFDAFLLPRNKQNTDLADQKFQEAVHRQTAIFGNSTLLPYFFQFFRDHCIQCTKNPLLECDQKTSKCVCWNRYAIDKKARRNNFEMCRTKLGDTCDDFLGAKCVRNAFCNATFRCECLENDLPCEGNVRNNAFGIQPNQTINHARNAGILTTILLLLFWTVSLLTF